MTQPVKRPPLLSILRRDADINSLIKFANDQINWNKYFIEEIKGAAEELGSVAGVFEAFIEKIEIIYEEIIKVNERLNVIVKEIEIKREQRNSTQYL